MIFVDEFVAVGGFSCAPAISIETRQTEAFRRDSRILAALDREAPLARASELA